MSVAARGVDAGKAEVQGEILQESRLEETRFKEPRLFEGHNGRLCKEWESWRYQRVQDVKMMVALCEGTG